jgi:tRNA dimethylallyltransferase
MLESIKDTLPAAHDLRKMRETGVAASRQLAKRQLTWLRSMPQRHVLACDQADLQEQWQALLQRLSVL